VRIRLGLAGRLAVITGGALALLQFAAMAAYYSQRGEGEGHRFRPPFPEQVAALVQLLDTSPRAAPEPALRLAQAHGLRTTLSLEAPQVPADAQRLPQLESLIASGLEPRPPGTILAWLRNGGARVQEDPSPMEWLLGNRVHVSVALRDGRYLRISPGGDMTVRLFGLPSGFVIGVLGVLVATLAMLAVYRELRPLSHLARSVDTFRDVLRPETLAERGAPEVKALIRAINHMQARIASLVKSRTFVLAAISHDLRTYLTRLRLRMEFVPDGELREKAIRDVEDMQAIAEEALAFAKASLTAAPEGHADLIPPVRTVCEAYTQEGARVAFSAPEGPLPVRASPAALSRIAGNLIGNAVAHGGSAEVSLHSLPGAVELWCEDRGPGIPPQEREAIFEPFHRLEPSRSREHGGVGLGLTIVRQLAEGVGGHVRAEDRPGGGSRFRVWLPRWEDSPA
jgi:two-component system, OmpR family, osmolarity sensor histidine kinase EnvZ